MPTFKTDSSYNCNRNKCPHYQAVTNRASPRPEDIPLTKVDRDHLYDDHLRTFADWHEELYEKALEKISMLEKENADLKAQVEDLTHHVCKDVKEKKPTKKQAPVKVELAPAVAPTTVSVEEPGQPATQSAPEQYAHLGYYTHLFTGEPIETAVDPAAHVDGFCDHLTTDGVCIYKCTDRVRHGKNVCAMHLHSKASMKIAKNE